MKHVILSIALGVTAVASAALPTLADAAEARLRCELRVRHMRSRVSVDGRNLAPNAMYTARIASGTAIATSPPATAIGDEAEFDFDSNPADVRAGATAISFNFIRDRTVRAAIFDAGGVQVAGPVTATCDVK